MEHVFSNDMFSAGYGDIHNIRNEALIHICTVIFNKLFPLLAINCRLWQSLNRLLPAAFSLPPAGILLKLSV